MRRISCYNFIAAIPAIIGLFAGIVCAQPSFPKHAMPEFSIKPVTLYSLDSSESLREGRLGVPPVADSLLQQSPPSLLARNLFLSTWWGYHAAFGADMVTTEMVLSRGGYEADPLLTMFGNRNSAGVIGSAIVIHAAISWVSFRLYETAQRRHGAWRFILTATAIGLNSYYIGLHTYAAVNNANVYNEQGK